MRMIRDAEKWITLGLMALLIASQGLMEIDRTAWLPWAMWGVGIIGGTAVVARGLWVHSKEERA